MNNSVAQVPAVAHRVISDKRPTPVKADLRKSDNVTFRKEWRELGECLNFARRLVGWNIDELAEALKRDASQVGRWLRGEERTQVDVVIGVQQLRAPFIVAMAHGCPECEVQTTVIVRRMTA